MSTISRTYTFTDGTTAYGSQVESEISNIVTSYNNQDAGLSTMTSPVITTATITTATITTGTITSLAHAIMGYRRPLLKYISATQMDVENNTGTSNQTTIVFPDGTVRSVTEDTSSTNKYRRFDITATATFASGTMDSGIRSGISEATNTWYAIYAVKCTASGETANFILSGDTTLPLQANFSTLNTRYGTNGWAYLGLIRNGDNSGTTGDILNFRMTGNQTYFRNAAAANVTITVPGTRLATTAGATSLVYTYAAGTGAAQIPDNVVTGYLTFEFAAANTTAVIADGSDAKRFAQWHQNNVTGVIPLLANLEDGFTTKNGLSSSVAMDIFLSGFIDTVLGVGGNPLL